MLERPANMEFLALNALGLLSKAPPSMFSFGSRMKLRRMVTKPQTHPLYLTRGDKRLAGRVIECSGNYLMSAQAVAAFTGALLYRSQSGQTMRGVHPVEAVFDLVELRDSFDARGIHIRALEN